ncbi:ABC transporter permease [Bacillus sp. JCM 19041]|uniref:ABC transporter permease n=1 Tax=Bacillus sp. JCM 19041 TaxID=1460637 RepID=UPI0006CF8EA3
MSRLILKELTKTSLRELLRDPKNLFLILIFPLLFVIMFAVIEHLTPTQNEQLSLFEYMFPGILIFSLFSSGLIGTSTPLIEMRKTGTLKLLQVTPLTKSSFIISQIFVRFIIGSLQVLLFLIMGLFLNIIKFSSIIPIFGISLLGLLMILTLGFIFGSLLNSPEVAGALLGGLSAPLLMLSGVLMPLSIYDSNIIDSISMFIPFTYLGDLMRSTMFDIDPDVPIFLSIIAISAFTIVFYIFAKKTFKWM